MTTLQRLIRTASRRLAIVTLFATTAGPCLTADAIRPQFKTSALIVRARSAHVPEADQEDVGFFSFSTVDNV